MKIRKDTSKIFKFLFVIILFILSIIAMVFGSMNVAKNNSQKGLFGDSYFMSYKIDLSNQKNNEEKKETMLKVSESYSNWLISNNINVTNIHYNFEENANYGEVYVERLNVDKIKYNNEEEKRFQNPGLVALNSISTSRINIQQYNPNSNGSLDQIPTENTFGQYTDNTKPYSNVISSDDLNYLDAKKDHRDGSNKEIPKNYGVEIQLKDLAKPLNIKNFIDQKINAPEDSKKVEWIVFKDIDLLVAKLNYAKKIALSYNEAVKNGNDKEEQFKNIKFNYDTLPDDLKTWADKAIKGKNSNFNLDLVNQYNILYYYKNTKEDSTDSIPNANTSLTPIVDKHIIGTISYSNYNEWFPYADRLGQSNDGNTEETPPSDGGNDGDSSGGDSSGSTRNVVNAKEEETKISFQNATSDESQSQLINTFKTMVFAAPLSFSWTSGTTTTPPDVKSYLSPISSWRNSSYLQKNVIGMEAYESTMLAFGVAIFLIAIIILILYRIPGLFGGFAIIATSVFSVSMFVVLNLNFSISTIVGLLASTICSSVSVILYMERVKKLLKDRFSVFDATQLSMKRSFLSMLDVNIIVLLFGLGSVFIGKGEIVDFGLVLIVVSVLSIICILLYFLFPIYLLIGNKWMWNNKAHSYINFSKNNSITLDNIESFNKKYVRIIIPIVGAIAGISIILGIALFFTLGIQNSSYYNDANILYLNVAGTSVDNPQQILDALNSGGVNNNWRYLWTYDGVIDGNNSLSGSKIFAFENNNSLVNINSVIDSLKKLDSNFSDANVGLSIVNTKYAMDLTKSGIMSILVGYGFILVYGIFRLNFLSIFPLFIASSIGSLVPICITYLLWLPINAQFIYAMLLVSMIASIVSFTYISISKTRFNKRQLSQPSELINFTSFNMYYIKEIIIIFAMLIVGLSIVFFILGSKSMILLFMYIVVLTLFASTITYLLTPILYFVVLYIRQKYVRNVLTHLDMRINKGLIEVEEELIEGINKFR